jgi:hypothetical protein
MDGTWAFTTSWSRSVTCRRTSQCRVWRLEISVQRLATIIRSSVIAPCHTQFPISFDFDFHVPWGHGCAQDNGFCRFNRVRIPRTHMAMRHVTLHSDGRYEANAGRRTAPSPATSEKIKIQVAQVVLETRFCLKPRTHSSVPCSSLSRAMLSVTSRMLSIIEG